MQTTLILLSVILMLACLSFMISGFAGMFVSSFRPYRYRSMLASLGFFFAGVWSVYGVMTLLSRHDRNFLIQHPQLSSAIDVVVLFLCGSAGAALGYWIGNKHDTKFPNSPTYTIANYWKRERSN